MKLYYSPMSPYVRKVRAVAITLGLADRIEQVPQDPREPSGAYRAKNPLARIPALETDDGDVLFDSPVICEFLGHQAPDQAVYPPAGPDRWRALKQQAIGDGIMDAAVPLRHETLRPEARQSPEWLARYEGMITSALDALESEAAANRLSDVSDIGTLSIACALGYLDFRFADLVWRNGRPALARWFDGFATRPAIADTLPAQV